MTDKKLTNLDTDAHSPDSHLHRKESNNIPEHIRKWRNQRTAAMSTTRESNALNFK